MTITSAAPPPGVGVVLEPIVEFLDNCEFGAAAHEIRVQCGAKLLTHGGGFTKHLAKLVGKLTEVLDSGPGSCDGAPRRSAHAPDQEAAVDEVVEGLLRKLRHGGDRLSDDSLNDSIDDILRGEAFAKLTLTEGVAERGLDAYAGNLSVDDIDVQLDWEHAERGLAAGIQQPKANAAHAPDTAVPPKLLGERQDDAAAAAAAVPSAHYGLRRPRGMLAAAEDQEGDDEYHDDEDPGYRIREIYEAELLAELAHRSALAMRGSQNPRAPAPSEAPAASPQAEAEATSPRAGSQCNRSPRAAKDVRYEPSGDAFYPVELDGVVYDSFNLRIVHERDKTGFEESKEFQISVNSVIAARYQIVEYLGSAAFSRAVQCLDLERNKMVCMKIIKNDKDFFDQSLDEIKLLKYLNVNGNVDEHRILRLYDYFYYKEHLIIVTELLRDNLYEFSKFLRDSGDPPYFTLGRLQKVSKQVLTALEYIHSLRLIHCDLKPENILIQSYSNCEVKVIDFGSSCFVDDHLSSYVQSRSYRAPEVMLGVPYDQKVDIWSLGCIIAELWTGYVLFQNDSVQSLLARIIGIVGEFPYHIMTRGRSVPQYFTQDGQLYQEIDGHACAARGRRLHLLVPKKTSLKQRMSTDSADFLDFLGQLLQLDASRRPTAREALEHPFLTQCCYSDGL